MIIYGVSKAGRIYRELQPTVEDDPAKAKSRAKCKDRTRAYDSERKKMKK